MEKMTGKEKRAKKREALIRVLTFCKGNTKDQALLNDITVLTPGFRAAGISRIGVMDTIGSLFQSQPEITEDQIWKEYKLGRVEMRKLTRNLIKGKNNIKN